MFFTASTYRRLNAYFLDSLVVFFIKAFFISILFFWKGIPLLKSILYGDISFLESVIITFTASTSPNRSFFMALLFFLAWRILSFIYHWWFLAFCGATIGKMAFGLQVVSQSKIDGNKVDDGEGLGILQAFIRVFSMMGFQFFISFAYVAFALLNVQRIHLGDLVAGTRVIQQKPLPRSHVPKPFWGIGLMLFFVLGRLGAFILLFWSFHIHV